MKKRKGCPGFRYHEKDRNIKWCFCKHCNTLSNKIAHDGWGTELVCPKCGWNLDWKPSTYILTTEDYDDSRVYYTGERQLDVRLDCRTGQREAA